MRRTILERGELYDALVRVVESVVKGRVLGVIVFGSTVYLGRGRDIDVLVVVEGDIDAKEKVRLELEVSRRLRKVFGGLVFDVHVMSLNDFRENLTPGSFLSGLALGYEVLVDRADIEDDILGFLERLANEKYILHNRYGDWNLSHYARVTLNTRKLRRGEKT